MERCVENANCSLLRLKFLPQSLADRMSYQRLEHGLKADGSPSLDAGGAGEDGAM